MLKTFVCLVFKIGYQITIVQKIIFILEVVSFFTPGLSLIVSLLLFGDLHLLRLSIREHNWERRGDRIRNYLASVGF